MRLTAPAARAKRSGLLVVAVGLVLALGMAACGQQETAGPEEGPADVEDVTQGIGVLEDSEYFVGKAVTVSAEVSEVIGPAAFTIAGEGGTPKPLLILSAPNSLPNISDDSVVRVSGTVREFDVVAGERELGVDLDDERLGEYADDHAIVANKVEILRAQEGR